MNLIKKFLENRRENLDSLERFLENSEKCSLSEEEARESIRRGVAEITYQDGQHCANALFVGKGYFVTVKHAMDERSKKFISDYLGRVFPLKTKAMIAEKKDLALGRFGGAVEDFSSYEFARRSIEGRLPRVLLTRRNREIITKPVFLQGKNHFLKDGENLYEINSYTRNACEGDSGGIYATLKGGVEGMHIGLSKCEISPAIKQEEIGKIIRAYLSYRKK